MLIGDGGGYGATDWMGMDVIQMWQAIENQDTTAHYQLLTGWRKSYELTLEHLAQVQNYRQSLAEAWPPETSAASAAYIQRLDDLITNLQATYDAAVANHDAFANATLAISMSRDDVKTASHLGLFLVNKPSRAARRKQIRAQARRRNPRKWEASRS